MNHTVNDNVPTCDYINYFKKFSYLSLKLLIICGTYDYRQIFNSELLKNITEEQGIPQYPYT